MSWHDKMSIKQMLKIRDDFSISTFAETGTYVGINARFHANNFKHVLSCESSLEYFLIAADKTIGLINVRLYCMDSSIFLKRFIEEYKKNDRSDIVFFYLDAHFYDPKLPKEDRWVVVNELKALRDFHNCIICIHDFGCQGLGHLVYDGENLDFNLVGPHLKEVNPNFNYYTNTKEWIDIHTAESIVDVVGMESDDDTLECIRFAHTSETKRDRGILYCTPRELDLDKYQLKKGFS